MRVRVIFRLQNRGASVPFYHQNLLTDMLDSIVSEHTGEYHFSALKGQTRVSKGGLHYCSRRVTLVLSCINRKDCDDMLRKIFAQKLWEVGDLRLEPEFVELEREPELKEIVKFVCISPTILSSASSRRNLKEFLAPDNEAFTDLLYESTMNRMLHAGYIDSSDLHELTKFQLIPDRRYLEKIQQEEKKFARIYRVRQDNEEIEVRGYTFPFVLCAPLRVQQYIMAAGFGEFCDQGFGMLDLAHSDHASRTILYPDFLPVGQTFHINNTPEPEFLFEQSEYFTGIKSA